MLELHPTLEALGLGVRCRSRRCKVYACDFAGFRAQYRARIADERLMTGDDAAPYQRPMKAISFALPGIGKTTHPS
jgi:hypothetical protein